MVEELNNLSLQAGSSFDTVFAKHANITEQIVLFPDESVDLGEYNRILVSKFIDRFDAESGDVVHLVGCSNGEFDSVYDGEQLVADRSARVEAELVLGGIPQERIISEGCWSTSLADRRYPTRAVVMTLKRPVDGG
ncbi:MAG: hypothetical protein CSB44_01915 [Gammaproteobacteria bacterium]|nr:MAG: hypothetical protein CSB44_01915 [Gammaproteobacteria bacterium]